MFTWSAGVHTAYTYIFISVAYLLIYHQIAIIASGHSALVFAQWFDLTFPLSCLSLFLVCRSQCVLPERGKIS